MAAWRGFWQSHRCDERCSLLHGNYLQHKKLMESFKADPTGRGCTSTVKQYRGDVNFKPRSGDAAMLDMIEGTCCR